MSPKVNYEETDIKSDFTQFMIYVFLNNFYSSEKSQSNSLCYLCFDFLGGGKLKSLLCRESLPLRDMEIQLVDTIFTLSAVNNVMSRTTTVQHVILDDASVLFEDDHPGQSRQPWGGACAVSWGAWAFTSGRHYWELDVALSSSWVLGVCKSPIIFTQDTSISIGAEEAFFLCSTKANSQYILSTTSPPLVHFVKRPLGRIGVFLDYDNGTVSFYDVFRSSLIYSSLPSAFSSPLIPFLCLKSS